MNTNNDLLTRTECNMLRGIAILGIILHNYCHWLGPVIKENEYQYFQSNADAFSHAIVAPGYLTFAHVLSFFGHYGVPLFLFLSAYGLVLKYERNLRQTSLTVIKPGKADFISYHFLKLFSIMVVGYSAFLMVDYMTPGHYTYTFVNVLAQLAMVNNLMPNPDDVIWPGPYWFFGLMIQFYIIYRLFLYRCRWVTVMLWIAGCWALQAWCNPEGELLNRLRYNFIGGMLPFGLGLLAARYCRRIRRQPLAVIGIAAVIVVVALSFNYQTWYWVPAFVCVAGVAAAACLSKSQILTKILNWLGVISSALFVCHPVTRKIFIPISRQGDIYTGLLIYVVTTLCMGYFFSYLFKKLPKPELKYKSRNN